MDGHAASLFLSSLARVLVDTRRFAEAEAPLGGDPPGPTNSWARRYSGWVLGQASRYTEAECA